MKYFIIFKSDSMVECAVAALAHVLLDDVVSLPATRDNDIRSLKVIRNARVIMLGAHWSKQCIESIVNQDNFVMLCDYESSPDSGYHSSFMDTLVFKDSITTPVIEVNKVDQCYRERAVGPLTCFINYMSQAGDMSKTVATIVRLQWKFINAIDAYCLKCADDSREVDIIITAIFGSVCEYRNYEELLYYLFSGGIDQKKFRDKGKQIISNMQQQ